MLTAQAQVASNGARGQALSLRTCCRPCGPRLTGKYKERAMSDRHICTASDPWDRTKSERAEHPDALEVSDRDYGGGEYCVTYQCPHCGKMFEVEIAQ